MDRIYVAVWYGDRAEAYEMETLEGARGFVKGALTVTSGDELSHACLEPDLDLAAEFESLGTPELAAMKKAIQEKKNEHMVATDWGDLGLVLEVLDELIEDIDDSRCTKLEQERLDEAQQARRNIIEARRLANGPQGCPSCDGPGKDNCLLCGGTGVPFPEEQTEDE